MTRETKIGLVIAGSFLCLVSIVVTSKMRGGDIPPTARKDAPPPLAAIPPDDKPQKPAIVPPQPPTAPQPGLPNLNINSPAQVKPGAFSIEEELKQQMAKNEAEKMPKGKGDPPQPKGLASGNGAPPALPMDPVTIPSPTSKVGEPSPLPAFPVAEELGKQKKGVEPSLPKERQGLTPPPAALAEGGKQDSFGLIGPPPPALNGSTRDKIPEIPSPVAEAPKPAEVAVPPSALGGSKNDLPLVKKENKQIPPPPSKDDFGKVKITDTPLSFPKDLPPLTGTAKDVPKPGFPADLPPLNPAPKEMAKDAPKITTPIVAPSPLSSNQEAPKFDYKPKPFSAPATIPPLEKPNQAAFQAPALTTPPAPWQGELPNGNPIPKIPSREAPSLPPLGASVPPISIGGNKAGSVVQRTDMDLHVIQAGETNFAAVSQRLYNSDKYADALLAYNRAHQLALPGGKLSETLSPGQQVLHPPLGLLERDYSKLIRGLEPNAIAPVAGKAPVSLATPSPLLTTPPAPKLAVIPAQNPPSVPTSDRTQNYVVQNPRGESILDVAERALGDRSRWHEIYRVNPNYRPELAIPAGTSLRIPVN